MHKYGMLQRPAAVLASTPELLAGRARRAWLLFAAVALLIVLAALYGAGLYGRSTEIEALATQGRTDANLKVALLRAVLENPRALPLLLSEDQQVHDALTERSPASIDVLNRKLEGLVSGTKASVLYVTGTDGFAIASSNWREPVSFVGNDYGFRAYFSGAMQTGTAEYFALWFKEAAHETGFYWYVTACIFCSLIVYGLMPDTRQTSRIDRDEATARSRANA